MTDQVMDLDAMKTVLDQLMAIPAPTAMVLQMLSAILFAETEKFSQRRTAMMGSLKMTLIVKMDARVDQRKDIAVDLLLLEDS